MDGFASGVSVSIKCHTLWSHFNRIVAAMVTLMNYIVVFLFHMLCVVCSRAAYDNVIVILLCGCRCSLIHISDFYFWFSFIVIEVSDSRSLIRALAFVLFYMFRFITMVLMLSAHQLHILTSIDFIWAMMLCVCLRIRRLRLNFLSAEHRANTHTATRAA